MDNIYDFCLANPKDISAILDFYHSLIGTHGCTWSKDYPNEDILNHGEMVLYESRDRIYVCPIRAF